MSTTASNVSIDNKSIRHDWSKQDVLELLALPFNDLLFRAHSLHREFFDPNSVQISTLMSIKTGSCPEDCSYCPQSAHYDTGLEKEKLIEIDNVLQQAALAKDKGASRFCMGAAWRNLHERDVEYVVKLVKGVKDLGLESCMTLGMLSKEQANTLKDAGLDYYNHNLDTSREYYGDIITTRTYDDRLETLQHVRDAGMNVCCGGIVGLGEGLENRAGLLQELATLPKHPESVPINLLVQVEGTPLHGSDELDSLDFVRTIAVARILMPASYVRLSAGRENMNDETQALCFFAGANSIFYGEKLLTTPNPEADKDLALLERLGINTKEVESSACSS